MTEVAYPYVTAALIQLARDTFPVDLRVVRGYDISNDPGDVMLIGVPNLADVSAIAAGSYSQEQMGHGAAGLVTERGSISGLVMAWNGEATDLGAETAMTAAFGYIATLAAAVRANRSLSVPQSDFDLVVQTVTATGDIAEDKVDGATCAVSFTVNYIAQIEH